MSSYTELGASMAARAFFYPSLLFNIARERLQEDWHWCDLVAEVRRCLAAAAQPTSYAAVSYPAGADKSGRVKYMSTLC